MEFESSRLTSSTSTAVDVDEDMTRHEEYDEHDADDEEEDEDEDDEDDDESSSRFDSDVFETKPVLSYELASNSNVVDGVSADLFLAVDDVLFGPSLLEVGL